MKFLLIQIPEAIFVVLFVLKLLKYKAGINKKVFLITCFATLSYFDFGNVLILKQLLVSLLFVVIINLLTKIKIAKVLKSVFLTLLIIVLIESAMVVFLIIALKMHITTIQYSFVDYFITSLPVRAVQYYILTRRTL